MRTIASVKLAKCGRQEEIAQVAGVSRVTVSYWIAGRNTPNESRRAAIEEKYGISRGEWDRAATPRTEKKASKSEASPKPSAPEPEKPSRLARLEQMVDNAIQELELDPHTPPERKAKAMQSLSATLSTLTRVASELERKRLMASPFWWHFEKAIFEVTKAHPAVAKMIQAKFLELRELRGGMR